MNDVLRIARLKIALQRAFLGRAILIFTFISFLVVILFLAVQDNSIGDLVDYPQNCLP